MQTPSAALPTFIAPDHRRLLVGLLLSFVLHLLLALLFGAGPGQPTQPVPPRPLQVDLQRIEPPQEQPSEELVIDKRHADSTAESVAVAPPAPTPPVPQTVAPPREAAPGTELPFDRYFTARELDVRAEPVNDVDLVYPVRAYQMRIRGRVVLRLFINETGGIDEVTVLEATPPGVFEEAALTATLALQFRPAVRRGRNVKSQKVIEVVFDPYERINTP